MVHGIPTDGWCFYECVLRHLFPNGQEQLAAEQITTAMVAAFCVSCLAQRKEELACFVADSVEDQSKRVVALRKDTIYQRYLGYFGDFEMYVLDKLEAALRSTMVLDSHHYADTPEFEALQNTL